MSRLRIGITGGIGSGKTTVCKIFNVLGIPVFDADTEAKRLMETDPKLRKSISEAFGADAYREGKLNREYLAQMVFSDPKKLQQLNALVHPVVIEAGLNWSQNQTAPYTIKEAALLFESGSYQQNDFNVLVTSPMDVRLRRVQQRDGASREQVLTRMGKQWTDDQKSELADLFIVNDDVQALIPQVLQLHDYFLTESIR